MTPERNCRSSPSSVTETEPERYPQPEVVTMQGTAEYQTPQVGTKPPQNSSQYLHLQENVVRHIKRHSVFDSDVPDEMRHMLRTNPPVIEILRARFIAERHEKDKQEAIVAKAKDTAASKSKDTAGLKAERPTESEPNITN